MLCYGDAQMSYNQSHLRAIKLKGWLENSIEYWMWHIHGTLMLEAKEHYTHFLDGYVIQMLAKIYT